MPIQSPLLDDLSFNRIVEELKRRIPVYAPEWTDYNDSDPGISMIQLFAYLTEMVGYRLNRIPEKNHVELLKLLGIRLKPAHAATTRLAFFLSNPAASHGTTIDARSRATAKKGSPPPAFETETALDIVPCEPAVLITTKNPFLWDLARNRAGGTDPVDDTNTPAKNPSSDNAWLTVAWDGQKPMLKDFPVAPIAAFPPSVSRVEHPYLWIGLNFNPTRDAGFLGTQVTLTVQLDDDERPDETREELCATPLAAGEAAPPPVDWLAYYDVDQGGMVNVPWRIFDTTSKESGKPLTRSGTIRFTVPFSLGEITTEFKDLRSKITPSPESACAELGTAIKNSIPKAEAGTTPTVDLAKLQNALTSAVTAAQQSAQMAKQVPHPLDPKFRKIKGWLRIGPLSPPPPSKLRMLCFNAVGATNASSVENELLGASDGRPGQTYTLANTNILAGSLELAIQESADPNALLITWTEVDSLDGATPFDRVYALDAEAGIITFGDGKRGRIPPLVPGGGQVVAIRYRWGGGKSGEVAPGTVTVLAIQATGLMGVTNFVAATGGADAERLDDAKVRARKELSTRTRAVTASDFEWLALQTPTVRVARVQVVPLRRPLSSPLLHSQRARLLQQQAMMQALAVRQPYAPGSPSSFALGGELRRRASLAPGVYVQETSAQPECGPPLPVGPAGLDDNLEAPGAVSVVVVPDEEGPEPVPTPSFLRAVCEQLNKVRLVTTEVHVVPPQYCRLCQFTIKVKAQAGYTRSQLQDLVEARLATYLHVLRGGDEGKGYPFGGQVHIADLIALVFRTEGVERVDSLTARFARTKSNASPRTGLLTLCPERAGEYDHVDLGAEETASFDAASIALSTE
ncbi:MAG TPA: putative baseplate assembly protein [Polyangia bacterium]|jgi:hypothetical protein|nr:putative baseplate assembly protein [Polyangia bacterium]